MARNVIIPRWSETPGKKPTANDLEKHEIAINIADKKIYAKDSNNNIVTIASELPVGVIVTWAGNYNDIPDGWALCDGNNGTPDLRDKFIMGTVNSNDYKTTGGYRDATLPRHSHAVEDHSHNIYIYSAGSHKHALRYRNAKENASNSSNGTYYVTYDGSIVKDDFSEEAGSHSHSAYVYPKTGLKTEDTGYDVYGKNIPPYFKLAFIMKIR